MTIQRLGEGILLSCLIRFFQPLQGYTGIRLLFADSPAEIVVFFHSIQIGTDVFHAAQLSDGELTGNHNGDEQTVGDGIDPGIQPISGQNPDDTFFNPIGFGTGHRQPGAQFGCKFH